MRVQFPRAMVVIFVTFLMQTVSAQNDRQLPEYHLTLSEVSAHLRFLASDELMGRMTGTAGNDVAARYIAEQFRANGVRPLPGAEDYLQPVAITKVQQSELSRVVFFGDTLQQARNLLILQLQSGRIKAPMIYVDNERFGQENGEADLSSKDVRGKVVVTSFGSAQKTDMRSSFLASRAKRKVASASGALALIELYHGAMPWQGLAGFVSRPRYRLGEGNEEKREGDFAHILIDDHENVYLSRMTNSQGGSVLFDLQEPSKVAVKSSNVIGLIQGTDLKLRDEYVLLTAHFDHLGAGLFGRATPADSIFNGARDNGMGTVALLSAAKALAANPPSRSVVLLAVTGEEVGLLGSKYYVDHPLIPLDKTVFALNTDGGGFTDATLVTVIGLERTSARAAIEAGCAAFGLQAIADPEPAQNFFNRSDNISFARKGIPAPTFSEGFRAFDESILRYYHQPQDEADDHFDFNYLLRFCQAYSHAARLIAEMPETPRWAIGDEFEAASRELYR